MNRLLSTTLCAAVAAAALAGCKRNERPREPAPPLLSPPPGGPAMPPAGAPGQMPSGMAPQGAPAGQIAALQQATQKNPKDHEAWVQLGNLYFDSHQHQQAIAAYGKALELQPNDPNVLTDQGVMYRELKSFDKAVSNFEKASKIDPTHAQSLFNLGVVYAYDLNQPQKATAAWEKVIQIAPSSPQAMNARQAIGNLKGGAK
jgi:cytochrome c-type biogenesis protein CcmH/NrfG